MSRYGANVLGSVGGAGLTAAPLIINSTDTGVVAQLSSTLPGALTFSRLSGLSITVALNGQVSFTTALANGVTRQLVARAQNAAGQAVEMPLTFIGQGAAAPNFPPSWVSGTAASVVENTSASFYTCSATDPEGNSLTYSIIGGADFARFSLIGAALAFAVSPNFEVPTDADSNNVYQVTLGVSDGVNAVVPLVLSVTVTNANEAPTDVTVTWRSGFAGGNIPENSAIGTVLADLSTTDIDAASTFTYSKLSGDIRVGVVGATLVVAAALNFESGSNSPSISIRSTDNGGLTVDHTVSMTVTNVNEAPTAISVAWRVGHTGGNIREDVAIGATLADFTTVDPDAGDTVTYSKLSGDPRFGVSGSTLYIISALDFETGNIAPTVTVRATDSGSLVFDQVINIAITDVVESLPPLAAITGERDMGGWLAGYDNSINDTNTRAVVLPTQATQVNMTGDWSSILVVNTGSQVYTGGTSGRENLATVSTGSATNGNLSANTGGGMLYRDGATRRLFCQRNNSSTGGADFLPGGTAGAPVDTGITLEDHQAYVVVVGQKGNFPYFRVCNVDTNVLQSYDHPTDNRTYAGVANFYLTAAGAARSGTSLTNLDNFLNALGCWTQTSTKRNGFGGAYGSFGHCWASLSNAQVQALADGSLSIGSLASLRYWNRMILPATGTAIIAETVDRVGNVLPITGSATITLLGGTLLTPAHAGPFRFGGMIKLQREHAQYLFPMMPNRTTGRVFWDGTCGVAGYQNWVALGSTPGNTDVLAWTKKSDTSTIGSFNFTHDGLPPATTFYRSVWVGPAGSAAGGSDGHLFAERNPMELGLKHLIMGQSQRNKQLQTGTGASGTGVTQTPSAGAGRWWHVSYMHTTDSFAGLSVATGPLASLGPRRVDTLLGAIGDGTVTRLQRLAADLGWSLHLVHSSRSGHQLDAWVFDRTPQVLTATGTGTSRTASLVAPGIYDPNGTNSGVDPGSITITWTGNSITDAANAGFTGSQLTLAAGAQTFPAASGVTGTINYYTGALSLAFATDPGVVTVNWTTRYDTADGSNSTYKTVPDKFTMFGSTPTNGVVTKTAAMLFPRHGLSSWEWGGSTSSISQFGQLTEPNFLIVRDGRAAKLDALCARIWALSAGRKPPLILQYYGRGSGDATNNLMRRCDYELSFLKPYSPAASVDSSSGATTANYRWHCGTMTASNLYLNSGEHQTNGNTGGIRIGEMEGVGNVSLMQGNQSKARGPEFLSANVKAGNAAIIEVTPTYYRAGATGLVVDTANGAAASSLSNWYVLNNPLTLLDRTTEVACTASYNATTGKVELLKTSGLWSDLSVPTLLIRAHAYGPFMFEGTGVSLGSQVGDAQTAGHTAGDELAMASSLWDNAGGWTWAPGAEVVPVFGLRVT